MSVLSLHEGWCHGSGDDAAGGWPHACRQACSVLSVLNCLWNHQEKSHADDIGFHTNGACSWVHGFLLLFRWCGEGINGREFVVPTPHDELRSEWPLKQILHCAPETANKAAFDLLTKTSTCFQLVSVMQWINRMQLPAVNRES